MLDPRDQKFMPKKRDTIFVHKKDIPYLPNSVAEEVTKEEVKREEVDTAVGAAEEESGPSRVK